MAGSSAIGPESCRTGQPAAAGEPDRRKEVIALHKPFSGTSASKGEDRRTVGGREKEEYEEPLLTAHETLQDITGKLLQFYGEAKDFSFTEV
jgi:hypothetical protein